MVTVKNNEVNERIIMSKTHAIEKMYKRIDGSEVSYTQATSDILEVVDSSDEYSPAELTKLAGYKKSELQFLLPYLASQNVLKFGRTDDHKLKYFKIKPNALQELLYPLPNFPESAIKGSFIHRSK
tara:strand:- start:652 stop:1029 length:378 start_codon:yes stop_codon:yes gene_type:complete